MKESKNLKDRFEELDSFSNDPKLDWSIMGPALEARLKKDDTRKRGIIWWICGALVLLIVFGIAFNKRVYNELPASTAEENTDLKTERSSTEMEKAIEISKTSKDTNLEPNVSDIEGAFLEYNRVTTRKGLSLPITYNEKGDLIKLEDTTIKNHLREHSKEVLNSKPEVFSPFRNANSDSEAKPLPMESLARSLKQVKPLPYIDQALFLVDREKTVPSVVDVGYPIISRGKKIDLSWYAGANSSSITEEFDNSIPQLGISGGISMHYDFGKLFYLGGGVNYDRQRFTSELNRLDTINLYRPNSIDTIFQSSFGSVTTFKDSIRGTRQRVFKHHNSLTIVSLPVFIGRQLKVGRALINVEGGVQFNVFSSLKGRIVQEGFAVTTLQDQYWSSASMGFFLRSHFSIPVTEQLSIEPYYRFTIDSGQSSIGLEGNQSVQIHQFGLGMSTRF